MPATTLRSSRFVLLLGLSFFCVGLVVAVGLMRDRSSSTDPVPAVDPKVQECRDAGGEPVWVDGDIACLIDPATLER